MRAKQVRKEAAEIGDGSAIRNAAVNSFTLPTDSNGRFTGVVGNTSRRLVIIETRRACRFVSRCWSSHRRRRFRNVLYASRSLILIGRARRPVDHVHGEGAGVD